MDDQALMSAIRARATDPDRRLDYRESEFVGSIRSMDLGQLFSAGRKLSSQLRRVVRSGADDELMAEAERIQDAMDRPRDRPLPAPATPAALDAAEVAMSVTLPPLLRRLYGEVANGGFGPGSGLIGVRGGWTDDEGRSMEQLHEMLAEGDPDEPSWSWPVGLVPLLDQSPSWVCVDTTHGEGKVVRFDSEEIEYGGWAASFTAVAPSLNAWLSEWVKSRPAHEVQAEQMAAAMAPGSPMHVAEARRARAMIAAMSLEERRAMGLPDEGWEQVVWGGVGWEGDQSK